jgi:hypothetical protein
MELTPTGPSNRASGDEVDETNDQIAHRRISEARTGA